MRAVSTDPERGLPGEDPESPFLEDALHWVRVYEELLNLKHELLKRAEEVLQSASPEAQAEGGADQALLRAQAARYDVRLEFWRQRAKDLSSP